MLVQNLLDRYHPTLFSTLPVNGDVVVFCNTRRFQMATTEVGRGSYVTINDQGQSCCSCEGCCSCERRESICSEFFTGCHPVTWGMRYGCVAVINVVVGISLAFVDKTNKVGLIMLGTGLLQLAVAGILYGTYRVLSSNAVQPMSDAQIAAIKSSAERWQLLNEGARRNAEYKEYLRNASKT